jgi:hypothetical protein
MEYSVFCFADPTHANLFGERFNGEGFDPKIAVAATCGLFGRIVSRPTVEKAYVAEKIEWRSTCRSEVNAARVQKRNYTQG